MADRATAWPNRITNHPIFSTPGTLRHKFGYNADVGTTFEPVWDVGGAYTFLNVAGEALSVSSSSVADDLGSTGVTHVMIEGILSDGLAFTEKVIMDGQTAVPLTNVNVIAIDRVWAAAVGSGGENAGDIYVGNGTVTTGVPANIFAKVIVGNGQTLMAIYSAPKGRRVYLNGWSFTAARSGTVDTDARVVFRLDRGPWRVIMAKPFFQPELQETFHHPVYLGIGHNYGVDIKFEAKVSASTQPCGASFDILEEDL